MSTCVFDEGMTRAPVVRFPSASDAVWVNFNLKKISVPAPLNVDLQSVEKVVRCARKLLYHQSWVRIDEQVTISTRIFEFVAEFSPPSFAQLRAVDVAIDGNLAFIRFVAFTGDAMGMNMVSKWVVHLLFRRVLHSKRMVFRGCSLAMRLLKEKFPAMQLLALSGNYCVDKKAAAINWLVLFSVVLNA